MRPIRPSRKARFKAALALAGINQRDWAKTAGITRQHLNDTLNDKTVSAPLTQKVDDFIADVEQSVRAFA